MQVRSGAVVARVLASVITLAGLRSAYGDTRDIVKIADQATAIPGGAGNFASFSQPQTSLGNILFYGRDAAGKGGLYWFDPAAQGLTFAMTGSSNFGLYGRDVSYIESVAFNNSLYTTRGGLHKIADGLSLPSPSYGPGGPISMDDQLIVFTHTYDPGYPKPWVIGYGKVTADGKITTYGSGLYSVSVDRRLARGGHVAYSSQNLSVGIPSAYYIASSAGLFQFTNRIEFAGWSNFTLPGDDPSTTTVETFSSPSFSDDGNAVVFAAWSHPRGGTADQMIQRGLYTKTAGGQLRTVANNSTVVPGLDGATTFDTFGSLAIDGGNIAFIGAPSASPRGIFAESGGVLREIVSEGDTLDGKTIQSLSFSDDRPLSGYDLVFTATFTDGSTGLYLAEVPEPATASLVVVAAVTLAHRRRRPRRGRAI